MNSVISLREYLNSFTATRCHGPAPSVSTFSCATSAPHTDGAPIHAPGAPVGAWSTGGASWARGTGSAGPANEQPQGGRGSSLRTPAPRQARSRTALSAVLLAASWLGDGYRVAPNGGRSRDRCRVCWTNPVGPCAHTQKVAFDPAPTGGRDGIQPDTDLARRTPTRGQIVRITGRKTAGGERGLPALDELVIQNDDGTTMEFVSPSSGEIGSLTGLIEIPAGTFSAPGRAEPTCPICIEGSATEREHVPQEALGGRRMTRTCAQCNNVLGSKVELDLENWFDHALTRVGMDHDGEVPGKRHLPTIYYRKSKESDEFVLFPSGGFPDEVSRIMASGQFRLHYRLPDPRRWGLALLKHAYLAACLHLRMVPDTREARAIRADLIAARDTSANMRPPPSAAAERLKVYRSMVGRQGPPLALVARDDWSEGEPPDVLISLAGVLFVSWPFAELPPGTWQQREADA